MCNFSECKPFWYNYNGLCEQQCPAKTYSVSDETTAVCAPCHYSCLSCTGPLDTQCLQCHEDSELSSGFNGSQCILKDLAWTVQSSLWFYRMTILFTINFVVVAIAAIYIAVSWYARKRNSLMYSYSKVSYSSDGDARKEVDRLTGQENRCLSDSE